MIRRIIEKCIGLVVKKDIQEAAGPLQMATVLQSGAEAAIHYMKVISDNEQTDAVILVDASNAFNSMNRNTALHNIQILCSQFSSILINRYRLLVRMIVFGSKEIVSNEGTTQDDNLTMSFYALGTITLLNYLLIASPNAKDVCLADNISDTGTLVNLKKWPSTIISEGSKFGYYVTEDKSWLIVKNENLLNEAQQIFSNSDIKFTSVGKRHLGAAIGSSDFRKVYATEKVDNWYMEISKLSEFAKAQPHAAYSAFYHGEVHKFTSFLITIPGLQEYIKPLDDLIKNEFIRTLLQAIITDQDRVLYLRPIKHGGFGIQILSEISEIHYEHSKSISAPLASVIIMQGSQITDSKFINEIKYSKRKESDVLLKEKILTINQKLDAQTEKAIDDASQPGASSWLSAILLEQYGFASNKAEFRDA